MVELNHIMLFSLALPLCTCLWVFITQSKELLPTFAIILFTSLFAYKSTDQLIPLVKEFTRKAGLVGKDINKRGTPAGEKEV
jgi:hypothetical protein